jgi:hypothetical protein
MSEAETTRARKYSIPLHRLRGEDDCCALLAGATILYTSSEIPPRADWKGEPIMHPHSPEYRDRESMYYTPRSMYFKLKKSSVKILVIGSLLITACGPLPSEPPGGGSCSPGESTEECLQRAFDAINRLSVEVDGLRRVAEEASRQAGQCESRLDTLWINGSMCILSNGKCPSGFTKYAGHIRSIYIWEDRSKASFYLTPVKIGDSQIAWHGGSPYRHNEHAGDLIISACCK